jgi:GTP1/Obg family GTP-binding protein
MWASWWLDAAKVSGAIVLWISGVTVAVWAIGGRVGSVRRAVSQRWMRWLRATVGAAVEERLTATNGGSTIYDRVTAVDDRVTAVEILARDTHRSVADVGAQIERLSSHVAIVAETSKERAESAEDHVTRLEDRMDRNFEDLRRAVLYRLGIEHPDRPDTP